ncbi:MAG: hypothetical protein REI78_03015 [Pedobacter sp.]|nr:hypothetical protein [Pedobacter sp.]
MKYTVSFFKRKIKEINDGLEQENYIHRLRAQYEMEKGQLKKVAFYYRSVRTFQVLNKQAILTEGLSVRQAENWLEHFDAKANGFEIAIGNKFVNGFDSWIATYFEIIMSMEVSTLGTHSYLRHLCQGREGLYELAREMTDRFENETTGRFWDGELAVAVRVFCLQNNI